MTTNRAKRVTRIHESHMTKTQKDILGNDPLIDRIEKRPGPRHVNAQRKGKGGEREAITVLSSWLKPIYEQFEVPADKIERNLTQVREGGCDLKGLPWLSIEVKRQEARALTSWWGQTLKQTKPGEIPFLMWRHSRQPWRFRIRAPVVVGPLSVMLDMDLEADAAREWLQAQLTGRLLAAKRGEAFLDAA